MEMPEDKEVRQAAAEMVSDMHTLRYLQEKYPGTLIPGFASSLTDAKRLLERAAKEQVFKDFVSRVQS